MTQIIASRLFTISLPENVVESASVSIHLPETDDPDGDVWKCTVTTVMPSRERTKNIHGTDNLQALYLAVNYAVLEIEGLAHSYGHSITYDDMQDLTCGLHTS